MLKLEVLAVSQLFGLTYRYGRQLVVPERLEDPETFDVWELFPRAPAHVWAWLEERGNGEQMAELEL